MSVGGIEFSVYLTFRMLNYWFYYFAVVWFLITITIGQCKNGVYKSLGLKSQTINSELLLCFFVARIPPGLKWTQKVGQKPTKNYKDVNQTFISREGADSRTSQTRYPE